MSTARTSGRLSLTLPDLADPGYRGEAEPLTTDMHFNYTGWLRAQKIVPATALKVGANDLVVTNGAATGASAIRATQIQLKYIWDKSDYLLAHRPVNLCDGCAVTLKEPKHLGGVRRR